MKIEDPRFVRFVLDRKLSMQKLLRLAGYQVTSQGSCFCMFHEDTNHRSAKLYTDSKPEHLFCFAERKTYRASDVITLLLNHSLEPYFEKVWASMDDIEKSSMKVTFSRPLDVIPDSWRELKSEVFPRWRAGLTTFSELLERLEVYYQTEEKCELR